MATIIISTAIVVSALIIGLTVKNKPIPTGQENTVKDSAPGSWWAWGLIGWVFGILSTISVLTIYVITNFGNVIQTLIK